MALRSYSTPPSEQPPPFTLQQLVPHAEHFQQQHEQAKGLKRGRDQEGEESEEDDDDDDGLWCQYCIDDPSVPICCFCGCRVSACVDV